MSFSTNVRLEDKIAEFEDKKKPTKYSFVNHAPMRMHIPVKQLLYKLKCIKTATCNAIVLF